MQAVTSLVLLALAAVRRIGAAGWVVAGMVSLTAAYGGVQLVRHVTHHGGNVTAGTDGNSTVTGDPAAVAPGAAADGKKSTSKAAGPASKTAATAAAGTAAGGGGVTPGGGTTAAASSVAPRAETLEPDPGNYNVTVDFADIIAQVGPMSLGGTESGYGTAWQADNQGNCANTQCSAMKRLGLGAYRVSVQWNNGNPVSGAGGNGTGGTPGDQLVDTIRAAGGEPVIVIGGKGGSNDMDFTDADAQGLVSHYTSGKYSGAKAVRYWVVGNEPSNSGNGSMTVGGYCSKFNSSATAMRQAYGDIKLVGPAWPYYDLNVIKQFLQCAGNNVDVVDYHAYGQSSQGIDSNVQSSADVYEAQNKAVRAAIVSLVPARASTIAQQVGEYNVSPFATSDNADDRFYTAGNTVWNAIATGSILKGGGRAFIFSDQNNPLGLIFQSSSIAGQYGRTAGSPQPAFHGIGMFSGEGLFRRFGGSMVRADSSDSNIVAYASAGSRNLVLVNRDKTSAHTARIQLQNSATSTATVWQTDANRPFDNPAQKDSLRVGGGFSYSLPAYSVTTVLLD